MNRETITRLHHVRRVCDQMRELVAPVTRDEFLQENMNVYVIERLMGIAGEALTVAQRETPEIEHMIPDIRRAMLLGNMLLRITYDANHDIVWSAAIDFVPRLDRQVKDVLVRESSESLDALIWSTDPFLLDRPRVS